MNECLLNTHACGENSVCSNTIGGFTCACAEGFANITADGEQCEGMDPEESTDHFQMEREGEAVRPNIWTKYLKFFQQAKITMISLF